MTPRGPVFVAGLERSGTSLMYALLASHPNIAMTRRTNLWTHFFDQYGDLGSDDDLDRCLDMMKRYRRLAILEPDWCRLRREFRVGERTYARLFALLEEQYAQRLGRPRWGDKSLNTERYAPEVLAAYPGARVLHMLRDPRDRYASSKTRWMVRRGGVGAGTAEWLASARCAVEYQARFPDRYRIVRYESLASYPQETLREVCDFIDEEYTPAMLSMEGAPRFKDEGGNSSYGARDSATIAPDSIGRFRTVLSARDVALIQMFARQEMPAFEYATQDVEIGPIRRVALVVGDLPFETARLVAWRAREGVRNRRGRPVPSYRLIEAGRAT
jgi:Sulfotransferase family